MRECPLELQLLTKYCVLSWVVVRFMMKFVLQGIDFSYTKTYGDIYLYRKFCRGIHVDIPIIIYRGGEDRATIT